MIKKIKALYLFYSMARKTDKLAKLLATEMVVIADMDSLLITSEEDAYKEGVAPWNYYYCSNCGKLLKRTYRDKFVKEYTNGRLPNLA